MLPNGIGAPDLAGQQVLDVATGQPFQAGLVERTTDPVILPQPYVSPADFTAQYPQPLDPTEILAMCEEISIWQALPEEMTALNALTWREMNALAFTSGSAYLWFATGECPEEYTHSGNNLTVTLKNLGAKKSLAISDIMHSAAISSAGWNGINALIGGFPAGEGAPGGTDVATFRQEHLADVKEKEIRTAMTLVLNGWDRYLVSGNASSNSLEIDGFENYATNMANCTFHTNDNSGSGSFASTNFDRFLSESCAKPTHVFGHTQAIQEMMLAYYSLGFQGSQIVNFATGDRIVPGFNFAGFVNTGVGRLAVVADTNFTRTDIGGGNFQAVLYAMRMNHNGEPLVYKLTSIPLALKDLTPGCTAISFEVWARTALIIKGCCAQGAYTTQFTGRIVTTCTQIG